MRVVGGEFGGRRLVVPSGGRTRPTSELVRGSVLNSLDSLGITEGAVVVDLFAGSGALGIEALSRGAASATFVDSERPALAALSANLRSLGLEPRATVVAREVLGWLGGAPSAAGIADIVFADPPYGFEKWPELLDLLPARALVVCESDRSIATDDRHVLFRQKRHGGTVVSLLQPRGAA